MSKALSNYLFDGFTAGFAKVRGRRWSTWSVLFVTGVLLAAVPTQANASCGDGILDPGEECEAPFGGCCDPASCMVALPPAEPGARLRALADTRLMQRHQASNDGGAGLMWVKRGGISRALIGVDYSCQAAAAPTVDCAVLRTTVHDGVPKKDGTVFAAHRMLVDWEEGNQAFNRFPYAGNLGPTTGSGAGTTWGCQVDPQIGIDSDNDCDASELWTGGDDCGGSLCYDASPRKFRWLGFHQPNLLFDVTEDMPGVAAEQGSSWIVKIDVEEVRTGSAKFYTIQGAEFMAQNTAGPEAAGYFDYAPSVDLYGSGFVVPAAVVVSPVSLSSDDTPATITFDQTVGSGVSARPARWHNQTTGDWGYADPAVSTDWTADIPLAVGMNNIELRVFDACGTEGKTEILVSHVLPPRCGDGRVDAGEQCDDGNEADGDCCSATCTVEPDGSPCADADSCTIGSACNAGACAGGSVAPSDCRDAVLCYKAGTTKGTDKFAGAYGHGFVDHAGAGSLDLKRSFDLCVPAAVSGAVIEEPASGRMLYRAKDRSNNRTLPATAEATDRFGTVSLKLGKLSRFSAQAAWSTGGAAAAPAGVGISHACYAARAVGEFAAKDTQYAISDEFEARWYRLRRPSLLCLASHDPGGATANSDAHRLCYSVRKGSGESKHEGQTAVGTHDVFGQLQVDTRSEDLLCVPATVSFTS